MVKHLHTHMTPSRTNKNKGPLPPHLVSPSAWVDQVGVDEDHPPNNFTTCCSSSAVVPGISLHSALSAPGHTNNNSPTTTTTTHTIIQTQQTQQAQQNSKNNTSYIQKQSTQSPALALCTQARPCGNQQSHRLLNQNQQKTA